MLLILRWYPAGRLAGLGAAVALLWGSGACAQEAGAVVSSHAEESGSALSPAVRAGVWIAAVGGATLLAGVATGFVAKAREEEAWARCRRGSGRLPECPESARGDFDAARTFATAANVLWLGGGLLSVTGLGLVIGGASSQAQATHAKVEFTPTLGLDGPSVAVTGAF
jgi:hypothetical protein